MSRTLFCKFLRDVRVPLLLVGLLLAGYETLWAKITDRITAQLVPFFTKLALSSGQSLADIERELFAGPGEIVRALLGGNMLNLSDPQSTLSIGYIHPFAQAVFCIWAIGRAAGALAGEIDRGTMELLLAQPVPRRQVVLMHLAVDLFVIPLLCLCLILGTWLGIQIVGVKNVELTRFWYALVNVGALMFAISGYTMALSAIGRFRGRVLSWSLGVTLVQFLLNVLGQLWDVLAPWRPLSVFYYYQPQPIILGTGDRWFVPIGQATASDPGLFEVNVVAVLVAIGLIGYGVATAVFCKRDLPAPL